MSKHDGSSGGGHWDSAEIRRERESGWFKEHEAELIERAREKRREAERARLAAESLAERAEHRGRCPRCGERMKLDRVEEIDVEKCPACEGIFFERGELETLLLRHDSHRRGFFRKLLGLGD
jgi:Transcription factor zinc-finger